MTNTSDETQKKTKLNVKVLILAVIQLKSHPLWDTSYKQILRRLNFLSNLFVLYQESIVSVSSP